jgi:hypothetical protein
LTGKHSARASRVLACVFLLIALLAANAGADQPQPNLINNGTLAAGDAFMPDGWHPSGDADCRAFKWFHPPGAPGELRIIERSKTYAGTWSQSIALEPGWYELSGEVRAEGAAQESASALLGVRAGEVAGAALGNFRDWQKLEFYFKVDSPDPIDLECGLSNSPGSGRTKAFFRNLRLVKVEGVPSANATQFDLGQMRSQQPSGDERPHTEPPPDRWASLAEFVGLILAAALIWILLRPRPTAEADSPAIPNEQSRDRRGKIAVAFAMGVVFLIILAITRLEFVPGAGLHIVTPAAVLSDEPFYVMVINSILFDHDLELQDDFRRVAAGGADAGTRFRGIPFEHQTIVVNRRTGHHVLTAEQMPDFLRIRCDPEFSTASADVYEVSPHPVAWPALLALAIAPMHPAIGEVESEVSVVLALISWLTALFTYLVARRDRMGRAPAMAAVLILVVASPWLAYSRSFFPESGIGLALIVCLWAWMDERPVVAAVAAAVAAILKPPFAVVGAGIIVVELRRGRRREAIEAVSVLGASAIALCAFNYWLARTPVIAGVKGWQTTTSGFMSLFNTFLDPAHGLLIFAPWAIIALVAIAREARSTAIETRMLRYMAVPIALYLVVLISTSLTGGWCYGPRHWIAFLPWMALATVHATRRAGRPALLLCGVLVLLGAAIAIPGALRYPQLFAWPAWGAWQGWWQ